MLRLASFVRRWQDGKDRREFAGVLRNPSAPESRLWILGSDRLMWTLHGLEQMEVFEKCSVCEKIEVGEKHVIPCP